MSEPIRSFEQFWPFYLGEHRHPTNRLLHVAGSSLALAMVATGVLTGRAPLFLGAVVAGYAFAWVGHFAIEKNKPASFKYPLWSFAADWRMWALTLSGRLPSELRRLGL